MNTPFSPFRLRTLAAILVVLAGIAAVVWFGIRGKAGKEPETAPSAIRPVETAAAPALPTEPAPKVKDVPARSAIMPLDPETLGAFQEANSRATRQLSSDGRNRSYAVTASLSVRQAIAARGHDPDRTLQYWLSPQFADDLAAGDPAKAVSDRRTIDNLLSVILGDQADDEDFEQILAGLSPEIRSLVIRRRARH